MIFNEIYGAYYNAVAKIIEKSIQQKLTKDDIRDIIQEYAFGESAINIESSITKQKWQLIHKDGTTPITNIPTMPLTDIQKRWINAVSLDKRVKLFENELITFDDVEPLFLEEDIVLFDKYADGDPYDDENYTKIFRIILDAIRNDYLLDIKYTTKRGCVDRKAVKISMLEYSQKDDKFRAIGVKNNMQVTINLARIISCERYFGDYDIKMYDEVEPKKENLHIELVDKRGALQRALLHFAHFEKEVKRMDDFHYDIMVSYDKSDEAEMLIRVLSFGPMIKVIEPISFVNLIKERLINQKSHENISSQLFFHDNKNNLC